MQESKLKNLALWSLVLGVLSTPPFPFSIFAGIPAIVIGNRVRKNLKAGDVRINNMAKTGMILGYLSILLTTFIIVLIVTGNLKP